MGRIHEEEEDIHTVVKLEHGIEPGTTTIDEHQDMELRHQLEHYSFYALDSKDGSVIWQHDGSEVTDEQFTKSLPQHAYVLEADELSMQAHHTARPEDWYVYRQSLLAELPHTWQGRGDGFTRVAHFVRRQLGAGASRQAPSPHAHHMPASSKNSKTKKRSTGNAILGKGRFTGKEVPSLSLKAALPHDAAEHVEHPNVLVAHTHRGIEVIGLRSGHPITSLALGEAGLYADINGDGVVDTIYLIVTQDDAEEMNQMYGNKDVEALRHCMFIVLSGLPPKEQLFNGTMCARRPSFQEPLIRHNIRPPDNVHAAAPVVLPRRQRTDVKESKLKDLVFATNVGIITCYSGNGELLWQITDGPSWPIDSEHVEAFGVFAFDWNAGRAEELGSHSNEYAQFLVVGDSRMSLISRTGDVLYTAEYSAPPITMPTLGDFNDDGVTDVVLVLGDSVIGYELIMTPSPRGLLVAYIIIVILAIIVFFSKIQVLDDGKAGILRSTDDAHFD